MSNIPVEKMDKMDDLNTDLNELENKIYETKSLSSWTNTLKYKVDKDILLKIDKQFNNLSNIISEAIYYFNNRNGTIFK